MPNAAALPRIAVYVTGDVPDNEKRALGTRMLAALVNSGRYMGIERGNAFIAEIEREQVRQRSGAVDDSQISELGRQFGVKYVCIADITPAFGTFQVSARIVDVETAVVVSIGDAFSPLKTGDDLTQVSEKVVESMFGEQLPVRRATGQGDANLESKPRNLLSKPEISLSAGGGIAYFGDFGGGIEWDLALEQIAMPYNGFGAYLFFDATYAEAFIGFSTGGGKWKSNNASNPNFLPNMSRAYINFGIFAKYPVAIESSRNINVFPLLGIDYEVSVSGNLKYADGSEYPFDGKRDRVGNIRPKTGDLSALWFKFGGGFDIDLNQSIYLRSELLYGFRTINAFENYRAKTNSGAKARGGHGLTLRVGTGLRF